MPRIQRQGFLELGCGAIQISLHIKSNAEIHICVSKVRFPSNALLELAARLINLSDSFQCFSQRQVTKWLMWVTRQTFLKRHYCLSRIAKDNQGITDRVLKIRITWYKRERCLQFCQRFRTFFFSQRDT